MLRRIPGAQRAEHHRDEKNSATAHNQWEKDCKNGATRLRFMCAREANATYNQSPNACDESATNRNQLQQSGRALRKGKDPECSLEGLFGASD